MSTPDTPRKTPRLGVAGFVAFQIVLITVAMAWGAYRIRERSAERALPPLRPEPLVIQPQYDYEVVITDDQLRRTLSKFGLKSKGARTAIGHTDHMLRCWGPSVTFENPDFLSGTDMVRVLTDHRRFVEVYGSDKDPLLIDEGPGVRVRAFEGVASSSHVDHTMACLAEVGATLELPIITSTRQTTYRAILEQSLRDFNLNQAEYEWSALTYALFLPPTNRWIGADGQEVSFDRLADRIMREALPQGVCSANHRLHALVMFLRADDQMDEHAKILSPEVRQRILDFLREITATYVKHQHPDGFWNGNWPDSAPTSSEPTDDERDELSNRIIVTGHVLEWWALAPQEVHPPRGTLAAAGQWLVRTIDSLTPEQIQDYSSYLSHSVRALAMWRGKFPHEVSLSEN